MTDAGTEATTDVPERDERIVLSGPEDKRWYYWLLLPAEAGARFAGPTGSLEGIWTPKALSSTRSQLVAHAHTRNADDRDVLACDLLDLFVVEMEHWQQMSTGPFDPQRGRAEEPRILFYLSMWMRSKAIRIGIKRTKESRLTQPLDPPDHPNPDKPTAEVAAPAANVWPGRSSQPRQKHWGIPTTVADLRIRWRYRLTVARIRGRALGSGHFKGQRACTPEIDAELVDAYLAGLVRERWQANEPLSGYIADLYHDHRCDGPHPNNRSNDARHCRRAIHPSSWRAIVELRLQTARRAWGSCRCADWASHVVAGEMQRSGWPEFDARTPISMGFVFDMLEAHHKRLMADGLPETASTRFKDLLPDVAFLPRPSGPPLLSLDPSREIKSSLGDQLVYIGRYLVWQLVMVQDVGGDPESVPPPTFGYEPPK